MKKSERPPDGFFTSSKGVVRAIKIIFDATCAKDIHIFWPDILYESPSRVACVLNFNVSKTVLVLSLKNRFDHGETIVRGS